LFAKLDSKLTKIQFSVRKTTARAHAQSQAYLSLILSLIRVWRNLNVQLETNATAHVQIQTYFFSELVFACD